MPVHTACSQPGCPFFVARRGLCARCYRTTSQRGYGTTHQAERRELAKTLPRECAYGCGTMLTAGDRWVAAHVVDGDPRAGYVVSCGPCNERAKVATAERNRARVVAR